MSLLCLKWVGFTWPSWCNACWWQDEAHPTPKGSPLHSQRKPIPLPREAHSTPRGSPLHSQRKLIPLPREAHSTPKGSPLHSKGAGVNKLSHSTLHMPWSKNTLLFSQTTAAVCSLVTSLHRQPLINFHRVLISLWAVTSNSCSVDYYTSSSGRRSLSSSPFCRCSNVALYINKAAAMDVVHSSNHLHHNDLIYKYIKSLCKKYPSMFMCERQ